MTIKHLWDWYPAEAITFGNTVFIKDKSRNNPAILAHEAVHSRQQAEHPVWFWVSYLLLLPVGWNPFRTRWEAEAYAEEVRYGLSVDIAAAWLSSSTYGWCCRESKAREEIALRLS